MWNLLCSPTVRILAIACMAVASLACNAGPKEDIEADVRAGRWTQANTRLEAVIAQHPDNALAHYWRAQVLEQLARPAEALAELDRAVGIDPKLGFATDPQRVGALRARLWRPALAATGSHPGATQVATETPGGSWWSDALLPVGLGVGALLALLSAFLFARSRSTRRTEDARLRRRLLADLDQASSSLRVSVAASDSNPAFSPEQRLSNFDRARAAEVAITALRHELRAPGGHDELVGLARRTRAAIEDASEVGAELRSMRRTARTSVSRQPAVPAMPWPERAPTSASPAATSELIDPLTAFHLGRMSAPSRERACPTVDLGATMPFSAAANASHAEGSSDSDTRTGSWSAPAPSSAFDFGGSSSSSSSFDSGSSSSWSSSD